MWNGGGRVRNRDRFSGEAAWEGGVEGLGTGKDPAVKLHVGEGGCKG